jgi:hypothetical protein
MPDPTCKTCPAFYVQTDDNDLMTVHECHKHAPIEGHWSSGHYLARWPEVSPGDWCGEHPDRKYPHADELHAMLFRVVDEAEIDEIGNHCVPTRTLADAEDLLATMEDEDA